LTEQALLTTTHKGNNSCQKSNNWCCDQGQRTGTSALENNTFFIF
jgi:hypothetical protein